MGSLPALGLLDNVVQFVDFASSFIGTVKETVATSFCAGTERTLELKTVYDTLRAFTIGLSKTDQNDGAQSASYFFSGGSTGEAAVRGLLGYENKEMREIRTRMQIHMEALKALASECKDVCDQLYLLVEGLYLKPGGPGKAYRWMKATVAGLKTAFAEKKMAELEERLKRFQRTIVLHYFPMIECQQSYQLCILSTIRLHGIQSSAEHNARLDNIEGTLVKMQLMLNSILDSGYSNALCIGENDDNTINTTSTKPGTYKGKGKATREDAAHHSSLGGLEDVLYSLTLTENDLATVVKEQCFVSSLHFESRTHRHEDIHTAHAATFQWIFASTEGHHDVAPNKVSSPAASGNLLKWLRFGSGTFWVSGKPGSGKSTFMKFVAGHEETEAALKQWAQPDRIIMAVHYFWSAGTTMQRSIKGLLQTLLYTVLRCYPDLAPSIFPNQWRNKKSTDSSEYKHWSMEELKAGLEAMAHHKAMPAKFCFFIDGLDEFDGNFADEYLGLCRLLEDLSSSAHIKCCVSSRPWNVFQDAFTRNPATTLCIHHLTFQDIHNYAKSRLMLHPRWKMLEISAVRAADFITSITERAKGVFLWVFLVTRSLRNGLTNSDTIDDLQRRLDSLPTELEPFFKHMLDRVELPDYQYMARTLQTAIAGGSLHLATYYARECEDLNSNYALERPPEPDLVPPNIPKKRLDPCRRRINARCGGLLGFDHGRVEFIHRTARDFLLTRPVQDYLEQRAGANDYEVQLALLKAHAFLFRCFLASSGFMGVVEHMETLFRKCLSYAVKALDEDEEATISLLSTFTDTPQDRSVRNASSVREIVLKGNQNRVKTVSSGPMHFISRSTRSTKGTPAQLGRIGPHLQHLFFEVGLEKFITAQLMRDPNYFSHTARPPMQMAAFSTTGPAATARIMIAFLNAGHDPNEPDPLSPYNKTPWHTVIRSYLAKGDSWRSSVLEPRNGQSLICKFLHSGAQRTQKMEYEGRNFFPLTHIVLDLFSAEHRNYSRHFTTAVDAFLAGSQEQTVLQLDDLFTHLRHQVLQRPPVHLLHKRNMYEVTEKLIEKGNAAGVDMQGLVTGIKVYFGIRGDPLVAMILNRKNNDNEKQQLQRPNMPTCYYKRLRRQAVPEESGESSRRSKRIKAEGSSQYRSVIWPAKNPSEVIEILDEE